MLECLQRSLKIADACMTGGVNAQLFIELLNHYVFFFEADNPEVRVYVSNIMIIFCVYTGGRTAKFFPFTSNSKDEPLWPETQGVFRH